MMGEDAVAGELERGKRLGVDGGARLRNLRGGNAQADVAEIHPVVTQGELDQRSVLLAPYLRDDRGNRFIDVGGGFPLGGQQLAKTALKIRRTSLQPQDHGVAGRASGDRAAGLSARMLRS